MTKQWIYITARDYRSDLGFIPQVGYRSFYAGTNHTWYAKPDQWWTQFIMEGEYRQLTDQTGLLSRIFTGTLVYLGPLDIHSLFEWVLERERYNGVLFDQNRFFIHHCMNPNKDSHASFNIWFGDRIDYANTRLGKRIRLRPGITYNIGLHWRLSFSHDFERLWVKSERLYTANQTELRLGYQFNKRTLLRAVLQYVDYRYNVDNYIDEIDPVYKHFFVQALFSYKINPQTVLFLGYSDNYYGYQYTGMPLVNRTVFLKFGYALVL